MFLVGKAKQENELWLRLLDWVTGVGWLGRQWPNGGNVGNGVFRDIRIGSLYQNYEFTFTLSSAAAHEGEFTVSRTDLRTGTVTAMPTARVNEVYDQSSGGNIIIQCYLDFGTIDFAVGDVIKIRAIEKTWQDKIGNDNASTPDLGSIEVNANTLTENIEVVCTYAGGAAGTNVVKNYTSAWGVEQDIVPYKNITIGHVKIGATTYVNGTDYIVDTVEGKITILPALDFTADITNGSAVLTNVVDINGTLEDAYVGLKISGVGIPVSATILAIDTTLNTITISINATISNTAQAVHVGGNMPDATLYEVQFDAVQTAAKFSVYGDTSGAMAEYIQGTVGTYTPIKFTIPAAGAANAVFYLDDQFVINTTVNELKNVDQQWAIEKSFRTWGSQQTQFGQVGGRGLEATDSNWLLLKGQGLSGDEEIYVGLSRGFNNAGQYAYWKLFGMRAYDNDLLSPTAPILAAQPGISYGQETKASGKAPVMHFWNSTIPYYIIADGNSIQVIAINNQAYCHMYMGFYIPYDYPTVNPYPLFIGGSGTEDQLNVNASDYRNSNFWSHFNVAGSSLEWASECWYGVGSTVKYKADDDETDADGTNPYVSHWTIFPWSWFGTKKLRKGFNGEWPLIRARLGLHLGELKGLYGTAGLDSQQAQNLMFDPVLNKKYVVIRNQTRLGSRNYAAVELS